MDMRVPPLENKSLPESNPLKSGSLVLEGTEGVPSQGMGVVSNSWFDCVLSLNSLHVQTTVLTGVQAPFLGIP